MTGSSTRLNLSPCAIPTPTPYAATTVSVSPAARAFM